MTFGGGDFGLADSIIIIASNGVTKPILYRREGAILGDDWDCKFPLSVRSEIT